MADNIKFLYGLRKFVDAMWFCASPAQKTALYTKKIQCVVLIEQGAARRSLGRVAAKHNISVTVRQVATEQAEDDAARADYERAECFIRSTVGLPASMNQLVFWSSFVGTPFLPLLLYGGHRVWKRLRDELFQIPARGAAAPSGDAVLTLPPGYASGAELLQAGGRAAPAGVAFTRLRPRARWVRALEATLGGSKGCVAKLIGRRWKPDLPDVGRADIQNYLLGGIEGGARLLGGGVTASKGEGEDKEPGHVYYIVDMGLGGQLIFPQLLASLRTYALYRERDSQLLGALRTRAQGWCKGVGLTPHIMDLAVAGATSMAMDPSTHERLASDHVREVLRRPLKPLLPS